MFARQLARATHRAVLRSRPLSLGLGQSFAHQAARSAATLQISFVDSSGATLKTVLAEAGQTILEAAHANNIDVEGACGGECACSTCHVIFDRATYDGLPEPDEEELDMLDLAAHVTDSSRLGCQVKLMAERDDGLKVRLPEGTANLFG